MVLFQNSVFDSLSESTVAEDIELPAIYESKQTNETEDKGPIIRHLSVLLQYGPFLWIFSTNFVRVHPQL